MESSAHIESYSALKADYAVACQRAEEAEKEADKYRVELVETRQKMLQFEHELAQLKRLVFGVRSERFEGMSPDQMPLFGEPAPVEEPLPIREPVTIARKKLSSDTQIYELRRHLLLRICRSVWVAIIVYFSVFLRGRAVGMSGL
jgi:Transposase C of IS166 homeodomain